MTRNHETPTWLALLVALLAVSMGRACVARADDALDLARLCAHEGGIGALDDCRGIWSVALHGAERTGETPGAYMRRYSRRFFAGTTTRAYYADLRADGSRPTGWPTRWSRHRDAWMAHLAECATIVTLPASCGALHWGSREDYARRRAHGHRDRFVDCGATRNLFSGRATP